MNLILTLVISVAAAIMIRSIVRSSCRKHTLRKIEFSIALVDKLMTFRHPDIELGEAVELEMARAYCCEGYSVNKVKHLVEDLEDLHKSLTNYGWHSGAYAEWQQCAKCLADYGYTLKPKMVSFGNSRVIPTPWYRVRAGQQTV